MSAEPESTTVTNVYRYTGPEFAAALGIPLPDGAKITAVTWHKTVNDDYGTIRASVKITVENRLERKPA